MFNYLYLPSFLNNYFDLSEKLKDEVCEVERIRIINYNLTGDLFLH